MTRKNQFELVTASFNNKEEPVHSQFEPSSLDIPSENQFEPGRTSFNDKERPVWASHNQFQQPVWASHSQFQQQGRTSS